MKPSEQSESSAGASQAMLSSPIKPQILIWQTSDTLLIPTSLAAKLTRVFQIDARLGSR